MDHRDERAFILHQLADVSVMHALGHYGPKIQEALNRRDADPAAFLDPALGDLLRPLTWSTPLIGAEAHRAVDALIGSHRRCWGKGTILLGPAGCGKTLVMRELARRYATDPGLPYHCVVQFDVAAAVAGTGTVGQLERKFTRMQKELLVRPRLILFVDEIHTIYGAGSYSTNETGLEQYYKQLMEHVIVSGATTLEEWAHIQDIDPAFASRFHPTVLAEPRREELLDIVRARSRELEDHHCLEVTMSAVKAACTVSQRAQVGNPRASLALLDASCTMASADGSTVDEGTVLTQAAIQYSDPLLDPSSTLRATVEVERLIAQSVRGQPGAAKELAQFMTRRALLPNASSVISALLFAGPTGVGKTFMAKRIADIMQRPVAVVGMGEVSSVDALLGNPSSHSSRTGRGKLPPILRRSPHGVVVLDEIEKAPASVRNSLLTVLQEGLCRPAKGGQISTKGILWILTTNAGAQTTSMGYAHEGTVHSKRRTEISTILSAEFLGRCQLIQFEHLERSTLVRICLDQLSVITEQLKRSGGEVICADPLGLANAIVGSRRSDARDLARQIEAYLQPLFDSVVAKSGTYSINVGTDGQCVAEAVGLTHLPLPAEAQCGSNGRI